MIDTTDRADWLTEAQPVAERVAAALSGLTFKRHIYAALKKLGFKPFTKKAEGTSAGIRPRVLGDFVVKSMYVAEEYDAKFCLPTLILGCNGFEPLPDGGKVSEQNIVLQPLCDNDMRRITPLWRRDNSPCDELNDFIEAVPNNIGIWKGKVGLLDW